MDLPCDDPAAGLDAYAETVLAAIGDRTDLVVGAHSLGGFTAPLVCARVPVQSLVLMAGMIPAPGETGTDWWANSGQTDATRDEPDRDLRELFLNGVEPGLADELLARSRGQTGTPMQEPWPLPAWPDVPTRYVLFRDDRLFPAAWARRHARERLAITAEEIGGGHCAYLSHPEELAERLAA
jgi:pimeloyl-ACP methyl ester carboxylesterase